MKNNTHISISNKITYIAPCIKSIDKGIRMTNRIPHGTWWSACLIVTPSSAAMASLLSRHFLKATNTSWQSLTL